MFSNDFQPSRQRVIDFSALAGLVLLWLAVVTVGPALLGKVAGWLLVYLVLTNGFTILAWLGKSSLWLIAGLLAVSMLGAMRVGLFGG